MKAAVCRVLIFSAIEIKIFYVIWTQIFSVIWAQIFSVIETQFVKYSTNWHFRSIYYQSDYQKMPLNGIKREVVGR